MKLSPRYPARCFGVLFTALAAAVLLTGCQNGTDQAKQAQTESAQQTENVSQTAAAQSVSYEQIPALTPETVITLVQDQISVRGEGATVSGNTVTIEQGGVYELTGTLSDGNIVVSSTDNQKVYLMLRDAHITSQTTAPLYIADAKRTVLYTVAGSENSFCDSAAGETAMEDTETAEYPGATVYAKDDLVFAGEGVLQITALGNNGVSGKDWVQVVSGTLQINAVNHGIRAKDYFAVCDGTVTVEAAGDGLKSTNDADASLGFVRIDGGTLDITAKQDGIDAQTQLQICGGAVNVHAGDESNYTPSGANASGMPGGTFGGRGGMAGYSASEQNAENDETDDDSVSMKGIKAGTALYVSGGELAVQAVSHCVHSSGDMQIDGGTLSVSSSYGKGFAAHGDLTFGGTCDVTVNGATEGIESKQSVQITGGSVRVLDATDDGVNTGGQASESDADAHGIHISGGYLYVCAPAGDGLDSNGNLTVSGGTAVVIGSNNGGNSCLDSEYGISHTGGTLLGVGSASSMWQDLANDLSGTYIANTSLGSGSDSLAVVDGQGAVLAYLDQSFANAQIGAVYFGEGGAAFVVGGTLAGQTNADGYAQSGTLSGGSTFSAGEITGGMGGMRGGGGGANAPGDAPRGKGGQPPV